MTDPKLAVPKLCGAQFSLEQMEETIRRQTELLLNSVIGLQRFNMAFAATTRVGAMAPRSHVFDSDKQLDGGGPEPGSLVPPSLRSAALAAALAPVSTVPTTASSGRGFTFEASDPVTGSAITAALNAPQQGADPNTFKQHVHDAFMQEYVRRPCVPPLCPCV